MPYFAAVPAVRGTHLIATIPERLVAGRSHDGLAVLRAPREIDELPYSMTWSARVDRDAPHQWLRQMVRSSVANDKRDPELPPPDDTQALLTGGIEDGLE